MMEFGVISSGTRGVYKSFRQVVVARGVREDVTGRRGALRTFHEFRRVEVILGKDYVSSREVRGGSWAVKTMLEERGGVYATLWGVGGVYGEFRKGIHEGAQMVEELSVVDK